MPRVAQHPQRTVGAGSRSTSRSMAASPLKGGASPMKMPLNDDRGEKVARLQSRQALHDLQMNQIKAAASPMRKLGGYERAASQSPRTPTQNAKGRGDKGRRRGKENEQLGTRSSSDLSGSALGGVFGDIGGSGTAVTPLKRVPILANFEEWMKMATDNKINATNSWNFALIDYFHDMSLLKEGDGVNFQKASCTLDGCVKIYTSRVDSVATETGKLLSGLADSGGNKGKSSGAGENDGEEEGDEEDEDGNGDGEGRKKRTKKTQRSSEATLAPSFTSLQLKKFELEFAVDPLFKKASADFDEGGAKGLLLNHLAIDGEGRIVFDSSDDAVDMEDADGGRRRSGSAEAVPNADDEEAQNRHSPAVRKQREEEVEIDLASLAAKFFPDLETLDEQDICPSLKTFNLGDPSGSLDTPFLKAPDEWKQDKPESDPALEERSGIMLDDDNALGFDDDDVFIGGMDLGHGTAFGEGGEAWAKEAALEPMLKVHRGDMDEDDAVGNGNGDGVVVGGFDPDSNRPYAVSLNHKPSDDHENILSYFDNALHKNWAGPEHWRIRRIKETTSASALPTRQRKEKEPFEIDFSSPLSQLLTDMIYTQASSNSSITLPKSQWRSKTRNLLPDDKHFNSRQLLRLFLKPRARLGSRKPAPGMPSRRNIAPSLDNAEPLDEEYWANHQPEQSPNDMQALSGDYDANFFADDDGLAFPGGVPDLDDDDDNFADAREQFSPPVEGADNPNQQVGIDGLVASSQGPDSGLANGNGLMPGGFGSQLVTQGGRRLRAEYVNYARVAKKVDVRRLKENLWKGIEPSFMSSSLVPLATTSPRSPETVRGPESEVPVDDPFAGGKELKFTNLMNGLQSIYPEQAMKDISTSYCFICLLHLANEKGLVLQGDEALGEIAVRRDIGVGEGYEGE